MIYNGIESVQGGTGWYLVVLSQYGAELFYTWWYSDSVGRLVLGGTGSVWSGTG